MTQSPVLSSMLGTAIGDAWGLPYEGLSRSRVAKRFKPERGYSFLFSYGMFSDDTEHTCMVLQSLLESGAEIDLFRKCLARRLRRWLLCLPAGIGFATLRSLIKLWFGVCPKKSGVFSAGNGPAMRSAVLGAAVDDTQILKALVTASTEITHSDPKANHGALAVAYAALFARTHAELTPQFYLNELSEFLPEIDPELRSLLQQAVDSATKGESTMEFADSLGLRKAISGYVYHTVPTALHAWFSHPRDLEAALIAIIRCGGDTDSTAAIVGGILGAGIGEEAIPERLTTKLIDWPLSVLWMKRLCAQFDSSSVKKEKPLQLPLWGVLPRNAIFIVIVLLHGFRRALPPYG